MLSWYNIIPTFTATYITMTMFAQPDKVTSCNGTTGIISCAPFFSLYPTCPFKQKGNLVKKEAPHLFGVHHLPFENEQILTFWESELSSNWLELCWMDNPHFLFISTPPGSDKHQCFKSICTILFTKQLPSSTWKGWKRFKSRYFKLLPLLFSPLSFSLFLLQSRKKKKKKLKKIVSLVQIKHQ